MKRWAWLWCGSLLSCAKGHSESPKPPADTPGIEAPASPHPVSQSPSAAATDSSVPLVDGPEYSDAWLVILASNSTAGERPQALERILAEPEAFEGAEPARLNSSRFKGLMPCYEVVVALASPDKAAAQALSKTLRARGLDHYLKNAGRWVGPRPSLEASCDRIRSGEMSACPNDLRFFEVWNDEVYLQVGAAEAISDRALAGAPAPTMLTSSGEAWSAPLSIRTVGELTIGDTLQLADIGASSSQTCTLDGFVALTRGTPHFSWREQGNTTRPGCGQAELFAKMSCPESLLGGLAATGELPRQAEAVGRPQPAPAAAQQALQDAKIWQDLRARAERETALEEVQLLEKITAQTWRLGSHEYQLVSGRLYTEEDMGCGELVVDFMVQGLLPAEGGPAAVPFQEATDWSGFLDSDTDGTFEVLHRFWPGGLMLSDSNGESLCEVSVAYCDCAC